MVYAILDTNGNIQITTDISGNYGYIMYNGQRIKMGPYQIVDDVEPTLSFGQLITGVTLSFQGSYVLRTKTVGYPSLADGKAAMKARARDVLEAYMGNLYGGPAQQIAYATGAVGLTAKTAYTNAQSTMIAAYQNFVADVNAAGTWQALQTVYNNYPQLQ